MRLKRYELVIPASAAACRLLRARVKSGNCVLIPVWCVVHDYATINSYALHLNCVMMRFCSVDAQGLIAQGVHTNQYDIVFIYIYIYIIIITIIIYNLSVFTLRGCVYVHVYECVCV